MTPLDTLNYRLAFQSSAEQRRFITEKIAHLDPVVEVMGGRWHSIAQTNNDSLALASAPWPIHPGADRLKWRGEAFEPGGIGTPGLREGEVAARPVGMPPELGMPYGEDPYARVARELYTPKTAPDILQRAAKHMQDRAAQRDQAGGERSMRRTVDAFNALTGHAVSERDGWLFMAVLKMARATTTPTGTPDDYEDLAAYAALAGESAQENKA